jgi:hypothetical protein
MQPGPVKYSRMLKARSTRSNSQPVVCCRHELRLPLGHLQDDRTDHGDPEGQGDELGEGSQASQARR